MTRTAKALILLLLSACFLACPTAAQDKSIKQFSASLTDFTAAEPVVIDNNFDDDEEELKNLTKLTVIRFKSKEPVQKDPQTYAQLVLLVFQYADEASAAGALRSVPADAEEEMRKEPEFNFVDGTILYKLVGGCVIGTERWDQIEKKLTDAVLGKGKSPDSFTKIECGGNVKVSGAR